MNEQRDGVAELLARLDHGAVGWTFDTLKVHLESQLRDAVEQIEALAVERNNRYDRQATQAEEAIKVGLAAAKEALQQAFAAANQAIAEAKAAHNESHAADARALALATGEMKERLAEMNQLRHQIESERGSYITRDVLDEVKRAAATEVRRVETTLGSEIESLKGTRAQNEGGLSSRAASRLQGNWLVTAFVAVIGLFIGGSGVAIAVVSLVTR